MQGELDYQVIESSVTLVASHCSTNQARINHMNRKKAFSIHSASGSETVLTYRLLCVPLISISFPAWQKGETQLSRSLNVSSLALRAIAMVVFSVNFISGLFPPSRKT